MKASTGNRLILSLYAAMMLAVGLTFGCTELEEPGGGPGQVLTKVYELSSDAVTAEGQAAVRSSANVNTGEFVWTGASTEQVSYYTTYGSTTREVKTTGTQSGTTTKVSVEYTSGDNYVVMLTKGGSVGAVSTKTTSTWAVTNGIPTTQDGTIDGSLVSIGRASIGANSLSLVPSQAYISFSLASLTVGGKTVSSFAIRGEAGTDAESSDDIAANSVTYSVTGGYSSYTGGQKLISLKDGVTVAKETKYFFAVLPKEYGSGIRIILKDNTGAEIGYVITGKKITPAAGHVTNLGAVDLHNRVLPTEMKIEPENVHIVNETSCKMTKKLYVKAVPQDVTDIEWISSDATVATVAAGEDWYDTDGTRYLTATVTPVATPTWKEEKTCTITARTKLKTAWTDGETKATRTVYVGWFVDLGLPSGLLWCANNVTGSAADPTTAKPLGKEGPGTLQLTTDTKLDGDHYAFGWVTARTEGTTQHNAAYFKRWTDQSTTYNYTWVGYASGSTEQLTGGKYKKGNTKLDQYDDVAQVMTQELGASLKMRMPTKAEVDELVKAANTTIEVFSDAGGGLGDKITSKTKFYEDMWIYITYSGVILHTGLNFCAGQGYQLNSSEVNYENNRSGRIWWDRITDDGGFSEYADMTLVDGCINVLCYRHFITSLRPDIRQSGIVRPVKARP